MKDIEIIEDEKEFDEHYDKIINALENNDINITDEVSTKDVLNLTNYLEKEYFVAETKAILYETIIDSVEDNSKGVNVGHYNDDIEDFLSFKGK